MLATAIVLLSLGAQTLSAQPSIAQKCNQLEKPTFQIQPGLGNFQQCVDIGGKYCLGQVSSGNGTSVVLPTWALCLPEECTADDANTIGRLQVSVNFSDFLCQSRKSVNPKLTFGAAATLVFLAVLALAVLVSTLLDFYHVLRGKKLGGSIFSIYANSRGIFKTSTTADQLPCLDGLKFISMMWVVAGHQYSVLTSNSIANPEEVIHWANSLRSMFLVSGTLAVDTFFTVTGVLISYGFLKRRLKGTPINLSLYYVHRYLRLTPPLAVVVLVSATLLKYMGSGPKWPLFVKFFQGNCEQYWWTSLLYVQNYANVANMCVGQTWYLNIDMQLYLVSPLILLLLWKYPKLALSVLVASSAVLIGVSFHVAWKYQLPAILSNPYTTHVEEYHNKYYLLTHTRATPWIFGIILGYFIFQLRHNEVQFPQNKVVVWFIWVLCLGTLLACVLGGHDTLRTPEYQKLGNAIHIALVRPVWSLAIAWIILACTTNYGGPVNWVLSLPVYQILNKFTYSIYLTHVTLLYVIEYNKKSGDYFSEFSMMYQFWGTLAFSTGLAALLVFMVECPMVRLEKKMLAWFGSKEKSFRLHQPDRSYQLVRINKVCIDPV